MYRVGHGYDSHRFVTGGPLRLGGVDIEADYRLQGHSDGDAVTHALCDALLGAIGGGDIGASFPDTDEANRGADSLLFLRAVGERLRRAGYEVVSVDITVVTERPRLAPHTERMRGALATPLAVPAERINIKASTNEGMGFIGRGEGLAAWAVALVRSTASHPSG